jgi:hypothetical protein
MKNVAPEEIVAPARTAEQHQQELAALDRVRRRVMAIGFFAVIIHGVLGLVGAAEVVHGQGRTDDAVILLVLSAVVAVIMVVVIRAILGRSLASPLWLAIGLAPTVAGWIWVLG